MKKLIEILNKVEASKYRIKNNLDNNHIIYTHDIDSNNLVKKTLEEIQIKFYTFTPKNEKKIYRFKGN